MAKPFQFRYVNQIAGVFAAGIVLAVVLAVVLAGRAHKWFHPDTPVHVLLPPDGSSGLRVGGEVRMMGVTVGAVDQIDPPDPDTGRMTMRVHVDPRFAAFIRAGAPGNASGSAAIIHIPLALGDPYLEFTRGQGRPVDARTVLPASRESGAGDAVAQTVDEFRTRTMPAVQALVEQYTLLAADLRSREGPMQHTLAHIDQLTANLQRTDSVLGKLTSDKPLADELTQAVGRLSASADDLRAVMADLQRTSAGLPALTEQSRGVMAQASAAIGNVRDSTAQLPADMASLRRTIDTLPGVMAHTQQSLVEVERLVKGMEALPLIRDHVDATARGGSLRPTDLAEEP